jgi:hypothetical protein
MAQQGQLVASALDWVDSNSSWCNAVDNQRMSQTELTFGFVPCKTQNGWPLLHSFKA